MSIDATDEKFPAVGEAEAEAEADPNLSLFRLILIHISLCLCSALVGLDATIVAAAVPVITTTFDSIDDVGWYGAAFFLTLCSLLPLAGKLYMSFSKKAIYLTYLGIFEIGSLVCAVSPNSKALIAGRAIAGAGASGLLGGGLVILISIIPLHRRAIWQGTWTSVFSVSTIIGPLLGGAFTERVNWRWCFYINLPMGGVAAIFFFLTFRVKKTEMERAPLQQKLKALDCLGCVLFAGFITMLLFALQWGGLQYAWNSATIIGLLVGAGVTAIVFVLWQLHLQDVALIPPKLFDRRNAGLLCAVGVFAPGPFQTIIYWSPIWFQAVWGVSPIGSSIRYLPTVISDVLAALISAGIVSILGWWNPFLLLGTVTMSIGGGLFTTIYPNIAFGSILGYQILAGVGYALVTNMSQLGMPASLPPEVAPIGATSLLTVMCASCAVFLAAAQTVFQDRLQANLPTDFPAHYRAQLVNLGATSLRSTFDTETLPVVVSAYSKSIAQVWYIPAAGAALAFIFAACCSWISLKKNNPESSGETASFDSDKQAREE